MTEVDAVYCCWPLLVLPISAESQRQIIVPLARRYRTEDTVAVVHARPKAKMSYLGADLLCARDCAASKAKVCEQSSLQIALAVLTPPEKRLKLK